MCVPNVFFLVQPISLAFHHTLTMIPGQAQKAMYLFNELGWLCCRIVAVLFAWFQSR
jgi:hypothetical protein